MNVQILANDAQRAPVYMEHRWGERVALDHPVALGNREADIATGRLLNASISGALISTDARLPPLAPVMVTIFVNGDRARAVTLAACVVRTERGAVAVEWRDMAAKELVAILDGAG